MSRILKTYLLLLFIGTGALLFGQADQRVNDYKIWYGRDLPGIDYPDSGKVEEGAYIDGRKEGKWIKYHRDGKTPKLICYYENNRPTGGYEAFNEDGSPRERGTFRKNAYSDTLRRNYNNGQPEYIGWYNENGKEHGLIRYYYPNGQLEVTYTAINGIPQDSMIRYYENSEIKEIVYYDSEGTINRTKHYEQKNPPPLSDEKAPELPKGCVTGPGFKPDGYNKVFNEDKEIWQDGVFKEGCLWDGKVYIYDTDGILLQVKIFKSGAFHSFGQL